MELMDIIHQRKSVRKYLPKPVEQEKIIQCIEAARLAPSAENVQPWRFIVLDDPNEKEQFTREVCSGIYRPSLFIAKAPVIIVIVARLDLIANLIGKRIDL